MHPALLAIVIVVSQLLVALALLSVAGRLMRNELVRAAAKPRLPNRPSRFIRDLRPLQDLLVEFVGASGASAGILSVLSGHLKPLPLTAIAQEVRFEQERRREDYVLPVSIAWTVLCILLMPGLVRISRHGFVITEVGREAQRRIEVHSVTSVKSHASRINARTLRSTSAALTDGHRPAVSPTFS